MNISAGQQKALYQLNTIAQMGDAVEIISEKAPTSGADFLIVEVALSFKDVHRSSEGVPLRQRERFCIWIRPDFPYSHPLVTVPHLRWASWSHVQWGRQPCLYQAAETEWNPSDGMYGFIERLYEWVKHAALNQLDPVGAPLHPPVAYVTDPSLPFVIPFANTPVVKDNPWIGFGCIAHRSDQRIDVISWCEPHKTPNTKAVAAAVLLPRAASFEFPRKVRDLLTMLEQQNVPRGILLTLLGLAANRNGEGTPLLVLIGTPTRGISGSGSYQQHLVAWRLDSVIADGLRLILEQFSEWEKRREIGVKAEKIVLDWADNADVKWCPISEARPEVTVRRDVDSALGWFQSKTVAVWGCGAIGAHVAEMLARSGVKKLVLRDNKTVTPGVLVRQPFEDRDIGKNKAVATRERLRRIFPNLSIEALRGDVLREPLDDVEWTDGADLVIDATASVAMVEKLEAIKCNRPESKTVIASMLLGHQAQRALLCVVREQHTGACADVVRKTKIEVLRR